MLKFVYGNDYNTDTMKRTLLNLGAILAAFLIGLAINNACADSLENMSDSELRNLVAQLQKEVNNLKQKVAELEGKVNNSGSSNPSTPSITYGFDVDGLHFDNAGYVEEKIDRSGYDSYSYYIIDGKKTETSSTTDGMRYEYDEYGRMTKYVQDSGSAETTMTYTYSGKTRTLETFTKYENPTAGSLQESYSRSTTSFK